MKQDPYKRIMFRKWLIPKLIGAGIGLIVIIVVVVMVSMNDRSVRLNEGIAKSMPLLSNEKMKKLGDLYVKLNSEFEKEIKDMELNYANRLNKRGDRIHYGVNGRENVDMLTNDDYVNGIESITYIKGNAENRNDGESNFADMMAFLSASLGSDIDRYSEEQLESIFTSLFHLTHTFTGTSTELYPCDHGCSWCKYYCGDYMVQGEVGGNSVGFYQVDEYMGNEGQYGLMYDPFLISKRSDYRTLKNKAANRSELFTIFHNKGAYRAFGSGESRTYSLHTTYGRAVTGDDEIFDLMEAEGVCEVCSYFIRPFRNSTKTFAGCNPELTCYHGTPYIESDEGGNSHLVCMQCMYTEKENGCTNYSAHEDCKYEPPENAGDDLEPHECDDPELGCDGYYECEGHQHYSCPGHIIVTCFGHTNLNLEIKIMYYEEMIDKLKNYIN